MLGLIKALFSLSEAIPVLRSLLIDLVSMLKDLNAARRLRDRNAIINSRIDSILLRMHNKQSREHPKTDEQTRLP